MDKIPKGEITRQFTVWCGICGEWDMRTSIGLDNFIKAIEDKWRLSRDHGWCHRSCCKMMPITLKFHAPKTTEEAAPTETNSAD